eukprot:XP_028342187.1 uncharacterized protein LOC114485257 [Physeter catodon]
MAALHERRSSLPPPKLCYTAQQLYARYTRHRAASTVGGTSFEDSSPEQRSTEGPPPQHERDRASPRGSGTSGTSTTSASITGTGHEGAIGTDSAAALAGSADTSTSLEASGEGRRKSPKAGLVAAVAAGGLAAAGAAGGAAAAAARAGAAATVTLSAIKDTAAKGTGGDSERECADQNPEQDDEEAGDADEDRKRAVARLFSMSARGPQPLADWLKPGYDVYVITLQEVISDKVSEVISFFLDTEMKDTFLRVDMGRGKIAGRGKGAWTRKKATGKILHLLRCSGGRKRFCLAHTPPFGVNTVAR